MPDSIRTANLISSHGLPLCSNIQMPVSREDRTKFSRMHFLSAFFEYFERFFVCSFSSTSTGSIHVFSRCHSFVLIPLLRQFIVCSFCLLAHLFCTWFPLDTSPCVIFIANANLCLQLWPILDHDNYDSMSHRLVRFDYLVTFVMFSRRNGYATWNIHEFHSSCVFMRYWRNWLSHWLVNIDDITIA